MKREGDRARQVNLRYTVAPHSGEIAFMIMEKFKFYETDTHRIIITTIIISIKWFRV